MVRNGVFISIKVIIIKQLTGIVSTLVPGGIFSFKMKIGMLYGTKLFCYNYLYRTFYFRIQEYTKFIIKNLDAFNT